MTRFEPKTLDEWRMFDALARSRPSREYFRRVLTVTEKALLSARGEDLVREQGQMVHARAMIEMLDRAPDEVRKLERSQ